LSQLMNRRSIVFLVWLLASALLAGAQDGSVRIRLPKRSTTTPVQKLNRDGVKALEKHDYKKARKLFYDAYLLDPNDPFTLNNLGYISELSGEVDRAQRFYALAGEQRSEAIVDEASDPEVRGKQVAAVAGNAADKAMQINRYNVQAIGLLQKDRAPEADIVLQRALALDQKNPFTLNNLGFAKEKEGEYEIALRFYQEAAGANSDEPIIVTADPDWRGEPISKIADKNRAKLQDLMKQEETPEARVARLNLRGVSALNRNERATALKDFKDAYKLAPNDAFTLNNMGYVSELEGDKETAAFYYDKAQSARTAGEIVTVATRGDLQGLKLNAVANGNNEAVEQVLEVASAERRARGGPVVLLHRDNTPVIDPERPVAPPPPAEQPSGGGGLLMPLPSNAQPPNAGPATAAPPSAVAPPSTNTPAPGPSVPNPTTGATPNSSPSSVSPGPPPNPAPSTAQPGAPTGVSPSPPANSNSSAPANSPAGPGNNGGLLMPLPDNQQPANADHGTTPPPANSTPPGTPPSAATQPEAPANNNGGLLMPLPDNQQPANADHGPAEVPANSHPTTPSTPH